MVTRTVIPVACQSTGRISGNHCQSLTQNSSIRAARLALEDLPEEDPGALVRRLPQIRSGGPSSTIRPASMKIT